MFQILVLALTLSACLAEEMTQESVVPEPILVHNDYLSRSEQHRPRENMHRLRGELHIIRDRLHDDYRRDDRYREDRHRDDRHRNDRHRDDYGWSKRRDDHHEEDAEGPVILRSLNHKEHGHSPDIARQNKIIADVYSPDYAEPTWVLDYRYLKTGGRDYTRGPGGQIIILPKGIHTNEHKEFRNYDELIEHLRLKNLAERNKPQYFMPLGEGARHSPHNDHRVPLAYDEKNWWNQHYL